MTQHLVFRDSLLLNERERSPGYAKLEHGYPKQPCLKEKTCHKPFIFSIHKRNETDERFGLKNLPSKGYNHNPHIPSYTCTNAIHMLHFLSHRCQVTLSLQLGSGTEINNFSTKWAARDLGDFFGRKKPAAFAISGPC